MSTEKPMDRDMARALTDAGYMPVSRYIELFGEKGITDRLSDERLAEIEARAAAATPGPWEADGEPNNRIVWCGPEDRVCFMTSNGRGVENGDFIAHARDDIPALLAELKELRAEREWRPIETAPKDGTRILLAYKGGIQQGYWLDNSDKQWPWSGWKICDQQVPVNSYHKPEAWMPIPSFMAATEEQSDD